MPISLIANVSIYKNQLTYENDYLHLFGSQKYLDFFKGITMTKIQSLQNIVIMGSTLYDFIPENRKPLHDRINFVITVNPRYYPKNISKLQINNLQTTYPYFLTINEFIKFYKKHQDINVIVIGGNEIHNYFLSDKCEPIIVPNKLYITHVLNPLYNNPNDLPTTFMNNFDSKYELTGYSERLDHNDTTFRILIYANTNLPLKVKSEELQYLGIMKQIIQNTRNSICTKGSKVILPVFGTFMKFNVRQSIPVMTTRQFNFKDIVDKLLVFINTNAEQIDNVTDLVQSNPINRCILLQTHYSSFINDTLVDMSAVLLQFYVEQVNGIKYLSMQVTMTSSEIVITSAFQVSFYSILVYILAIKCNMEPKEIIYICGNTYIYKNQLKQVKDQLKYTLRPFPKLHINKSIKNKLWSDITSDDFELIGYMPHMPLDMPE